MDHQRPGFLEVFAGDEESLLLETMDTRSVERPLPRPHARNADVIDSQPMQRSRVGVRTDSHERDRGERLACGRPEEERESDARVDPLPSLVELDHGGRI